MMENPFAGMFSLDPNMTPQQIAEKRARLAAMMPQFGNARYVGQGLGQLATGIAMGMQNRKLDTVAGTNQQDANDMFSRIFGARNTGAATSGPMSVLGMPPINAPAPGSDEMIGADAMAALGTAEFTPGDRESFTKAMMPHALRVSARTGIDPRIVIAQAAQETGWGKSAPNNNFFGIKAPGNTGATMATNEAINGQTTRINDNFRTYGGMGQSADDYAQFLTDNPRYRGMLDAPDMNSQIAALGQSGYATDPNYASSVGAIAGSINIPGMEGSQPATAPPQIPMDQLYSALASPWITPEQKAVITDLIGQNTQNADPMRAIELEKSQIELEQMRNPQADPMAAIKLAQAELDLSQDRTGTGQDAATFGTTLQFWQDSGGKTRGGVIGNDGTLKEVAPPDGGDWATGIEKIDAGTKWLIYDKRTGQKIGEERKDIAGAAAQEQIGEAAGKAVVAAPSDISAAETTLGYIDSIRNHPGRVWGTGASAWTGAIPGGGAKEFQIEVSRLKSGAFLTAIEQLRGMGALSNAEGQTATAAVAALDVNGKEEGFLKRLAEYESIVNLGLNRAKAKIGGQAAPAQPAQPSQTLTYNPATGDFE